MGFSLESMIEALELALSEPETDGAKLREVQKALKWWKDYAVQCGQLKRPR
jgi:hypothetical protein